MKLADRPWEYLFEPFNRPGFPDLFDPLWMTALAFWVLQIVLYNVRSRQLHRHEPLVTMQEWMLWAGMITFGLVVVGALFNFYFFIILITLIAGLAAYVWIRFVRFPPLIDAYNQQLRRARFFSQSKYHRPEATVRSRRGGARRRR